MAQDAQRYAQPIPQESSTFPAVAGQSTLGLSNCHTFPYAFHSIVGADGAATSMVLIGAEKRRNRVNRRW
jgi:hypothetical protein